MKTTKFVVVALVLLSSFPVLVKHVAALQAHARAQQSSSASVSTAGNASAILSQTAILSQIRNETVGAAGNAAANAVPNLHGAGTGASYSSTAGDPLLAALPTAVPGLMAAGDASGLASGMLSAYRRNVHLDSGTEMVLAVSSAVSR